MIPLCECEFNHTDGTGVCQDCGRRRVEPCLQDTLDDIIGTLNEKLRAYGLVALQDGGAFVTTHPYGLAGEMREALLDALNYAAQITGRWRVTVARWLTWLAAMLLTAEIRRMK